MSIVKDLLDRLMEGRSPGDLFGKEDIPSELRKALAERALTTEMEEYLGEERAAEAPEGRNQGPSAAMAAAGRRLRRIPARSFWTFRAIAAAPSIHCWSAKYYRRFP